MDVFVYVVLPVTSLVLQRGQQCTVTNFVSLFQQMKKHGEVLLGIKYLKQLNMMTRYHPQVVY